MSSELSVGAVFAERYRVERRLAVGGMGAVYEVVHIETNRRRALKVLHTKFMQSEPLRERFRQEARVAAEIDSEHIVDIFDAGIDSATGMPFLVMELLRGEDMRARVRRDGPLSHDEALRCLYETSLALEKTHKANIVHRDLKPDNLFLCEREHGPPRVKVLDFGIAKIVADGTTDTQVTQSLGTPLYMAPEQFSMNSSVSPATDIYALGLIAYTLLVGKPYWITESKQARSPIAFALHASNGPRESAVARAARLNIHLPEAFDAWFFRTTAITPTDRFPSALAAVSELAAVLGLPLPNDPLRNRLSLVSPDESTLRSTKSEMQVTLDEPAQSNGPHSASVNSVCTVGASEIAEALPSSRLRPQMAIAVIALILMTGPVVDKLFGSWAQKEPTAASATPSAMTSTFEPVVEPLAIALPSASAAPPPTPVEISSAAAVSSANPPITGTKSPSVRPTGTPKKPRNSVIWNND